jgi:hypothetical protein
MVKENEVNACVLPVPRELHEIHWQTQVLKSHFYEGWLMVVSGEEKRSFVRGTEGQTLFACFF